MEKLGNHLINEMTDSCTICGQTSPQIHSVHGLTNCKPKDKEPLVKELGSRINFPVECVGETNLVKGFLYTIRDSRSQTICFTCKSLRDELVSLINQAAPTATEAVTYDVLKSLGWKKRDYWWHGTNISYYIDYHEGYHLHHNQRYFIKIENKQHLIDLMQVLRI